MHQGLAKAESSVLIQIRTDIISLRQYLCQRKVPGFESPECDCNEGIETSEHILIAYSHEDGRQV